MHAGERCPVADVEKSALDIMIRVVIGVVRGRPVRSNPSDIRLQRVPILRTVDIEVRRLPRQLLQRVSELTHGLPWLHAAEHNGLDVDSPRSVRAWCRSHVDGSCRAPGCRDSTEVLVVLVDPDRQRVLAVDVGLDDGVPALLEVLLHLTDERTRVHREVAGHDQQRLIAALPQLRDRQGHESQHAARALELVER